jgi:hypothetical protein
MTTLGASATDRAGPAGSKAAREKLVVLAGKIEVYVLGCASLAQNAVANCQ